MVSFRNAVDCFTKWRFIVRISFDLLSKACGLQAKIIDGNAIAATIRSEIKDEVDKLQAEKGIVPGLGVIIVGERKDSQTYVRMKKKASIADVVFVSFGRSALLNWSYQSFTTVARF